MADGSAKPSSGGASRGDSADAPQPAAAAAELQWQPPLPGSSEQRAIAAILVLASALLLLGPGGYCWLERDQGLAELAYSYRQSAHGGEGSCLECLAGGGKHHGRHHGVLAAERDHVSEVVTGGTHGLLMMTALVLGGIGVDIPSHGILAMGLASLTTYSVSTGFSAFVVEKTKEDFARSQLAAEIEEVRTTPLEEIDEMVCHYRRRGISEEDARTVAGVLSKYEDFWVEHMMVEELGLTMPRGAAVAVKSGIATCLSFFLCGLIPLLGVVVSLALHRSKGPRWYRPQFSTMVSLVLAAAALALLGSFLGRAFGSGAPHEGGALLLGFGCAAAGLALWLSQRCHSLLRCASGDEPLVRTASGGVRSASSGGGGSPTVSRTMSMKMDAVAWPTFRRKFVRGILGLWVAASTYIVLRQFAINVGYDVFRVWSYGMLTCVTTGLGAVPFLWAGADDFEERPLALANTAAGGMMLSASASMLIEAHEHCGPRDWQIVVGLLAGAVFIRASEQLSGGESNEEDMDESDVAALHKAFTERRHLKKAMLIFTVMFCHSAAEGIAVGVAFSKQLSAQFGLFVSLLLAIHNVPEGLAVALVLVPRGVSAPLAAVIATLTSVPQPFMAVAAFFFVDAFSWLLPIGLAFAAGAMVYVCARELLQEAAEQLGWATALSGTVASFVLMSLCIVLLQAATGA